MGDITFATGSDWASPLASGEPAPLLSSIKELTKRFSSKVSGSDITFNGNSHTWDGNGAFWWDGKGSNGGREQLRELFFGGWR